MKQMKWIVVSVAAFSMGASAFAMPKVGDDAVYDLTAIQNGRTLKETVETQLVSFNATTGQYDEKMIITMGAQSQTSDEQVGPDSLVSDAQVSDVLANCASYNGRTETVTVPAGTFNACALAFDNQQGKGTVWISNVSFAVVKQTGTLDDGTQMTLELQSQKSGQ